MPAKFEEFDWFGRPAAAGADRSAQQKMAENILDSYSRATDLLAEVLQNATDAVDMATEAKPTAKRKISIDFDAQARQFSVTDTGIGMSRGDLQLALGPNLTFKDGELAPPRKLRARGEKGVGLTFVAVACDRLVIRTCDGRRQIEAVIEGANRWVHAEGALRPPKAKIRETSASEELGSKTYTVVTVGGIDTDHFESDLFDVSQNDLVWAPRTDTAVGNTAVLYKTLDHPQPKKIDVRLTYTSRSGTRTVDKPVKYAYLSAEEFLDASDIVEFDDVVALKPLERRRRLRGRALRYVVRYESPSGRQVLVYALVMDGREMRRVLRARKKKKALVPPDDDWRGFRLATRDMPAGVRLGPGLLPTRAWEGRVLMVLQYDDLSLDLGRKTIAARTRSMLNTAVKTEWGGPFGTLARQVAPSAMLDEDAGRSALEAKIRRALLTAKLRADVPYMRVPTSVQGLAAVFHELVGARVDELPAFHPLTVRVFSDDDALIYTTSPNGAAPLHVVFAMDAVGVIEEFEKEGQYAKTADLAVVWELNEDGVESLGLRIAAASPGDDGGTHVLELAGLGGREEIRLLHLREVLGS